MARIRNMTEDDLQEHAARLGLEVRQLARWRSSFRRENRNCVGPPRGRRKRPRGMISVGDAVRRYRVSAGTLREWREDGLSFTTCGTMILMSEAELRTWIERKSGR